MPSLYLVGEEHHSYVEWHYCSCARF